MLNKRYARRLEVMLAAAVCIFLILLGRMAYRSPCQNMKTKNTTG